MSRRRSSDDVFLTVSDPTRRAILDLLAAGEQTVSQIVSRFDVTQSAISQHLKQLRDAQLVTTRKEGREVYYRLDAQPLFQIYDWVEHYRRFWTERLGKLGAYLDAKHGRKAPPE
jgi:DNA-binding transcriptional ArsR family regulator